MLGLFPRNPARVAIPFVQTGKIRIARALITKRGASSANTSSQSNMRFGARVMATDTTETETVTVRETIQKTYPQNWRAYNAAQTHEKEFFLELLRDLCSGVTEFERSKTGRPRLPTRDVIFAACYKVFSTVSARRFMSDLRHATHNGYMSRLPHFNSIFNYLENPELTPILRAMITETSLPLATVESDFAADSSGFATSRLIRSFDHKYGAPRQHHAADHEDLMCGVRTNIVTAVEIHDKDASDTKLLPDLVDATAG